VEEDAPAAVPSKGPIGPTKEQEEKKKPKKAFAGLKGGFFSKDAKASKRSQRPAARRERSPPPPSEEVPRAMVGSPQQKEGDEGGGVAPNALQGQAPPEARSAGPAPYLREVLQDGGLINMKLAHDIMLDGGIEVGPANSADPMAQALKDAMQRAYWDKFSATLDSGDLSACGDLISDEMESLVAHILDATPARTKERKAKIEAEVRAVLDITLLKQKIANGAFDGGQLYKMVRYVVEEHVLKLDAPAYDQDTTAWLQGVQAQLIRDDGVPLNPAEVLPGIFKFLMDKFSEIKFAVSNLTIRHELVPEILQYGADYERQRFEELIAKAAASEPPQEPLRRARQWYIQASALTHPAEEGKEDGFLRRVLQQGLLAMVFSPVAATRLNSLAGPGGEYEEIGQGGGEEGGIFPETLVWDAQRIEAFQSEVQLITLVGSTLLLCQEFFKRKGIVTSIPQQLELKTLLEKLLRSPRPTMEAILSGLLAKISEFVASGTEDTLLLDLRALLKDAIEKGEEQQVYKLLKRRLRDAARVCIVEGETVEEVMKGKAFSLVRPFTADIKVLLEKVSRVSQHHEKVYFYIYRNIAQELAASP